MALHLGRKRGEIISDFFYFFYLDQKTIKMRTVDLMRNNVNSDLKKTAE